MVGLIGVETTKEVFGRSFREIFLVCLHGVVHRGLDGDVAGLDKAVSPAWTRSMMTKACMMELAPRLRRS